VIELVAGRFSAEGCGWASPTVRLDACGYIVRLETIDRTIVNTDRIRWGNHDSAGFCLREPE
jgi:hypothetical protein